MDTRANADARRLRRVEQRDLDDIAAFLDTATDVPRTAPLSRIPVAHAGVAAERTEFSLPSFVAPGENILVHGVVHAGAALPAARRGVHMSRIVEAIDAAGSREWPSLYDFLDDLVRSVARRQELPSATVKLEGTALVRRLTPVTRRSSPDEFGIFGEARLTDDHVDASIGISAGVMTSCPCTQAFSAYSTLLSIAEDHGLDLANELADHIITYTHSQRGNLSISVDAGRDVDLDVLYGAMDAGAHLVHALLKRPDEHHLVRRSHERPQFTEDVVRSVAAELVERVGDAAPDALVRVTCRNIESIHPHDVESTVEGSVSELAGCLAHGE